MSSYLRTYLLILFTLISSNNYGEKSCRIVDETRRNEERWKRKRETTKNNNKESKSKHHTTGVSIRMGCSKPFKPKINCSTLKDDRWANQDEKFFLLRESGTALQSHWLLVN